MKKRKLLTPEQKEKAAITKKLWRDANKERIRLQGKDYYINNKNKRKEYNEDNKERIRENRKRYHTENQISLKNRRKEYVKENKDKISNSVKNYQQLNKIKISNYRKQYRINNIVTIREKRKEYDKNNRNKINTRLKKYINSSPLNKIKSNTRNLISSSIRQFGYKKNSKSEQILGCSFEHFKQYIENQFESWMNWDNCGNPKDGIYELNKTWDIDHIIPLSSAKTEEDVIRLNHYTNLKPLCTYYNRWIKGNKLF